MDTANKYLTEALVGLRVAERVWKVADEVRIRMLMDPKESEMAREEARNAAHDAEVSLRAQVRIVGFWFDRLAVPAYVPECEVCSETGRTLRLVSYDDERGQADSIRVCDDCREDA